MCVRRKLTPVKKNGGHARAPAAPVKQVLRVSA
jgi:hypothetical protein